MRNPHNEPLGSDRTGKRGGGKEAPERRCILTGRTACRDELLRLAISPPNAQGICDVLPDALARAPGRGAWIGVSRAELQQAMDKGQLKAALARSFRDGKLAIPQDLPVLLENALRRAVLERLGLEMRAGRLILGSDRISNEARMGKVAALYHASDASEDGSKKLDQAWRVGMDAEGSGETGDRLPLDRMALSVALGRDNVVHLALADRASAERVLIPLRRLQAFLGAGDEAGNSSDGAAGEAAHEPATTD
ncbi:RNA-binding protein [Alteraurantiacibacter aestuarii]|uniref:DUF448 domain-containing protein n=1 Tax=Alteraurantiacibacter aestuarii TaxID=650004 RepID=A0A844ZMN2_9SPHN|nr:DUF448 domain-containing protein [Alteraurantiacibacter aestuarii]MXO89028.1 DUF448 domain-containing protein [Alteraurantiacibacter aestuarii]